MNEQLLHIADRMQYLLAQLQEGQNIPEELEEEVDEIVEKFQLWKLEQKES